MRSARVLAFNSSSDDGLISSNSGLEPAIVDAIRSDPTHSISTIETRKIQNIATSVNTYLSARMTQHLRLSVHSYQMLEVDLVRLQPCTRGDDLELKLLSSGSVRTRSHSLSRLTCIKKSGSPSTHRRTCVAPGTSRPPGTSELAGRRTVPGSPPSPARSRQGSASPDLAGSPCSARTAPAPGR